MPPPNNPMDRCELGALFRCHVNPCTNCFYLRNLVMLGSFLFWSMAVCIMGSTHFDGDFIITTTNLDLTCAIEETLHRTGKLLILNSALASRPECRMLPQTNIIILFDLFVCY